PLPTVVVCYIIIEVLKGLVYAHGLTVAGRHLGIIHFDISLNNMLISSSGNIKLTDFGLSRVAAFTQEVSFIAGTPRHMSIEHHTATPRFESDIYGVGTVAHELVAGKQYHHGLNASQMREAVMRGVIHPIERDDVQRWLVHIITQMLDPDFRKRPSAQLALEIFVRNCPDYGQAVLLLADMYKDVVGSARSGQTQFLKAVPEQHQSFLAAPNEPPALIPASAETVGATMSTPPPMPAVAPDVATVIESPSTPPAIEPPLVVAGLPVEEPVEATELLPSFSKSHFSDPVPSASPTPIAHPQPRADSHSGDVVIAEPVPAPARAASRRILTGVGISVGMIALWSFGWTIGNLTNDDAEVETQVADEKKEDPQPAAVVASNEQPAQNGEAAQSSTATPEVDKSVEKEDPPVVAPVSGAESNEAV